ncbi:hypothetical protein C8R47DRAFT_1085074 [Mycena vitilis]|nr:hypothetical protein C8R47DRAFT_1085074 [Mycena vitilis]
MPIQSTVIADAKVHPNPALEQMLNSDNYPPSEDHAVFLRALLAIDTVELDYANSQIEQLSQDLHTHCAPYKISLCVVSNSAHARGTALRIFLHILPFGILFRRNRWDSTPMLIHQAPFFLGQICRVWRNVALNLPSLWTQIDIYHTWSQCDADNHLVPLPLLEAQLARSGSALLTITVESWSPTIDHVSRQLAAILPHSNRWLSLSLVCAENTHDRLLHLLRSAKGQLSQLNLLHVDAQGATESLWPSELFSVAPRLRNVLLSGNIHSNPSPSLLLPLTQLTRYRSYTSDENLLRTILPEAVNLVEAALQVSRPTGRRSHVTLPRLRRLCVDQARPHPDDPLVHPDFLVNLTAPQLEYLAACDALPEILQFIQRSSCELTTLVLTRDPFKLHTFAPPSAHLLVLLQHTPSLTHLVLQASNKLESNNLFLRAMRLSGSATDLCPQLVSFAFGTWLQRAPYSPADFTAMLHSRVHHLSQFTDFGGLLDQWDVLEWMAEARTIEHFTFIVADAGPPRTFANQRNRKADLRNQNERRS